MGPGDVWRVDTNCRDFDTSCFKFRELLLKTPQLGVTKRSPVPAIKDQNDALWRNQIRPCDLLPAFIRQVELGRLRDNVRGLCRERDLLQHIENLVTEKSEKRKAQHDED